MQDQIKPGYKEELSDMFTEGAYEALDPEDPKEYLYRKGKLLRFDYEGSVTNIRITRIDRKNHRMWGVHVQVADSKNAFTHYRHNIDTSPEAIAEKGGVWCSDCEVLIDEPSTEDGEVKAKERQERTLSDGTEIPDQE